MPLLWELGPTPRTHREAEADNPAWQLARGEAGLAEWGDLGRFPE